MSNATKFAVLGSLLLLFLGALAFPVIKADTLVPAHPVAGPPAAAVDDVVELPKMNTPFVIILLMQCDRPLGLIGVSTRGMIFELDAREFTPAQINKIGETVTVPYRHTSVVPCVSHTQHKLPQDTPATLRGDNPLTNVSLHVEQVPLPRLPSRKEGLDSQGHQPGTPESPCAPWQTPEFIDLVPGIPIFLTCYPIKGVAA